MTIFLINYRKIDEFINNIPFRFLSQSNIYVFNRQTKSFECKQENYASFITIHLKEKNLKI